MSVSLSASDLKQFEQKNCEVYRDYFDDEEFGKMSDEENCSGKFVEPLHVSRK